MAPKQIRSTPSIQVLYSQQSIHSTEVDSEDRKRAEKEIFRKSSSPERRRSLLVKSPKKSNLFINLGNLIRTIFLSLYFCHILVVFGLGDLMLSQLEKCLIHYWILDLRLQVIRGLSHSTCFFCPHIAIRQKKKRGTKRTEEGITVGEKFELE